MTNETALLRLKDAWRECERNLYHMSRALISLDSIMPMSGDDFEKLTDEQIQVVDQFILRFTKLQDALGGHLFPTVLEYLQEQYEDRPMLDKLNRLEKLGYIQSAEEWQNIRNVRNKFSHDYPDDSAKNAALLNLASSVAEAMYNILRKISDKLQGNNSDLALTPPLTSNLPVNWIR